MGPPGALQGLQRGPGISVQQLASWRVEDCAVYVLEDGKKKEIIKGSGPKGSHIFPVMNPAWAPRGAKEGARERALKIRVLEELKFPTVHTAPPST